MNSYEEDEDDDAEYVNVKFVRNMKNLKEEAWGVEGGNEYVQPVSEDEYDYEEDGPIQTTETKKIKNNTGQEEDETSEDTND